MTFYVSWLVDAARSTGYPVVALSGWESRGHGGMRVVEGVVGHHTATAQTAPGDYPSLGIVTNGRSDLAGPLANFGLGRNGTIYVIAAGLAYHAGASRWAGFTDLNDEFLGIEAESAGTGVWTDAQRDCYPKLVAALLRYMSRGTDRYAGHKDVCVPAGRKIDPVGIDTAWLRTRAATFTPGGGGGRPSNPQPTTTTEVELMERITITASKDTKTTRLWLPGGSNCKLIIRPAVEGDNDNPVWIQNVYAWASSPTRSAKVGIGYNPMDTAGYDFKIVYSREVKLPNAVWCDFEASSNKDFTVDILG
jgi:hypothetical protein